MKLKAKLIRTLKIWTIIYPSITAVLFLFGKQLSCLPLYQRTFVLTIMLVPWVVFIGIPALEFVVRAALKAYRSITDLFTT